MTRSRSWILAGTLSAGIACFLLSHPLGQSAPPAARPDLGGPAVTFLHTLPITITNHKSLATPAPFQQQIIVNSSQYSEYEAPNLDNIQFQSQKGDALPSWLESGDSSSSTTTIYWLRLEDGIPASSSVTINMEFDATTQNAFGGTTGEAPALAPFYGEYDSGGSVFRKYANFVGRSLPGGWYKGVTSETTGLVGISNGVTIIHTGTVDADDGYSFLGSNWAVGDNVAETHLLSQGTSNGQASVMACSESPVEYVFAPNEVAYQNGSGLEIEDNHGGSPSVLATANPNPTLPAVRGFQGGTLFANYKSVATATTICGDRGYLVVFTETGDGASFSFDWLRLRAEPPDGVMPTVQFGKIM